MGVLNGAVGTRKAFQAHNVMQAKTREGWMLQLALVWLPSLWWVMAQFVGQY